MKTSALASVLSSVLVLAGAAQAAPVNLIKNGSFEEGDKIGLICNGDAPNPAPGPYGQGCPWIQLDPSPAPQKLAFWRVDQGVVNWHNNQRPGPPQDGLWHIDLNDKDGALPLASLSQDFETTNGRSYQLFFYLSGPSLSFPDPRQVRVKVGGFNDVLSTGASNQDKLIWELETVTFQATGTTTTLTFSSVNSKGYWGAFIDNVCVQETGSNVCAASAPDAKVPEPASLGLLGLGLLGLGAARRRHGSGPAATARSFDQRT